MHARVINTHYSDVTSICNVDKAWQKWFISALHDVNSLRLNEEPLQHNSLLMPGSWCQLLFLLHVGSCTWWLGIPHSMVVAGFQEWVSPPQKNNSCIALDELASEVTWGHFHHTLSPPTFTASFMGLPWWPSG